METNSVNFKYGSTIEGKTISENDFVAINKGIGSEDEDLNKYGSIYKGDKILGTTEADNLVLTSDIVIAGGPLESDGKTAFGNTIPAGTSLQDIMMKLFCIEKWPTGVTTSDASLVSKMNAPTLTYNGQTSGQSIVEVGDLVEFTVTSGASSYTAYPYTASNFTYGYSLADDNTKDSSNTSKSASFGTISAVSTSVPTLTLSGKVSETVNGTAGASEAGAVTKIGTVRITEGDNNITVVGKSITYTGTCSALEALYGCSNLGNTNNKGTTYKSDAKAEKTITSSAVTSSSITVNCVGEYRAFVGYTSSIPSTSEAVRALNNNSRFGKGSCGSANTVYTISDNYMIVAIPSGWDFEIQNDLGQSDQRNSFKKNGTVNVVLKNGSDKTYDVWYIGWKGGAYKNLIIK